MAEQTTVNPIKLPEEVRKQLQEMDKAIATAKHGVETLKSLNMDVSAVEGQLKWAEEVRATLLEKFS